MMKRYRFFTELDVISIELKNGKFFPSVTVDIIDESGGDLKIYFREIVTRDYVNPAEQYVFYSDIRQYRILEHKFRIIK